MMRVLTRKIPVPAALSRLIGEARGVSAVEFALVAPLMISLFLGCVGISDGVAVDRKVSLIAGTLANLTASCSDSNSNSGGCPGNDISTTEMTNILAASSAIITPYSTTPLKMTISCIAVGLGRRQQADQLHVRQFRNGAEGQRHAADLCHGFLRLHADRRHQPHPSAHADRPHVHEPAREHAEL